MTDRDSAEARRTNLGRGLAALFGDENEDYASLDKVRSSKSVPIEHVHPNALQPRQEFDPEALKALSASIEENGVLQPILVRRHPERAGEYEIVAGERRWRASQMAQLHGHIVAHEMCPGQRCLPRIARIENQAINSLIRQNLNIVRTRRQVLLGDKASKLQFRGALRNNGADREETQRDMALSQTESRSQLVPDRLTGRLRNGIEKQTWDAPLSGGRSAGSKLLRGRADRIKRQVQVLDQGLCLGEPVPSQQQIRR